MKWYPNIAQAVISALTDIFNDERQADKVISFLLKSQKKWGSKDRRFTAQLLYDVVRWKRLYETLANDSILSKSGKWKIIGIWSILHKHPLPDWKEFEPLKEIDFFKKTKQIQDEKIIQSIPDWLHEAGKKELGAQWLDEISALNAEAEVVIRTNTLKTNKTKLQQILSSENIESHTKNDFPDALFIKGRKKLTHLKAYRNGLFEIQDASSQLVAPFSSAKPEMTVIDACAGAGGKTLHLAAQMKNKGEILAYDIYQPKLDELQKRAQRNAVKSIREVAVISEEIIKKNLDKADILLLDAPCSSIGTLRRKPDLKWKLNPERIKQINLTQKNIIHDYAGMVKKNGLLVYVTCSIFPSENQEIVKNFLKQNKNFIFVAEKTILPSESGHDGFYMAKLQKAK